MEKNELLPEKGKVRVIFHNASDADGPVKYSLNGRAGVIPREKEVVLDVGVLRGCFENAVEYKYPPDSNGGLLPVVRSQRYPYTVLGIVGEKKQGEKPTKESHDAVGTTGSPA